MKIYQDLLDRKCKLAVIGLGYVGLPLAVAFAEKVDVIGFDINEEKLNHYRAGVDVTGEVQNQGLAKTSMEFTSDPSKLSEARFHIVAVPTPISGNKMPDLKPLVGATEIVGKQLKPGSIVVYESTVYPGVTEEVCIPLLEEHSGLCCGQDFYVGYSPERINPGDKKNTLKTIKKLVSAMDERSLTVIKAVYELIIEAGVHPVSSIRAAEAAKVAENAQRDINIAFMNELAMAFKKMNIDTLDVIEAMNTKWNALGFYPGLVGGHCIGVDPYYFIYKAQELGYHSQIIKAGRKINDEMANFVGQEIIKQLIDADKKVKGAKVAILGITFKENCGDIRNSKVVDVIAHLEEYGVEICVVDPWADAEEVAKEYGITLCDGESLGNMDAVVVAVAHKQFKVMDADAYKGFYGEGKKVLLDIKGILPKEIVDTGEFTYWRL